eukprot:COSAG06_NODE_2520_length_6728_cov_2.725449_4_plen_88_part_00
MWASPFHHLSPCHASPQPVAQLLSPIHQGMVGADGRVLEPQGVKSAWELSDGSYQNTYFTCLAVSDDSGVILTTAHYNIHNAAVFCT